MKFLFLTFLVLTGTVYAQETSKQIYKSPDFSDAIARHKVVAILPFEVSVTYKKQPKNFDPEVAKKEEEALCEELQTEMFTYLLRKSDKYIVTFQDVNKTNKLLKQAGVFDKLDEITSDSIAKILNVDAVIINKYAYSKTASESGAIVKTVLFGGLGSKVGSGLLVMNINDGKSGDMIWRFSKKMDDTVFSSANQLIERMMRKVSRNFPYDK